MKRHCLENKHVNGLYWTYLDPVKPENYNVILEDTSFTGEKRSLIISTREDYPFRIVASAIALDWQDHDKLWQNSIKYVVEGKTNIALIAKKSSTSYDFKYFTSWLNVNKIPFKKYEAEIIDPGGIEANIHSIYLIDPAFSVSETAAFIAFISPVIEEGKAEVIFFNEQGLPKPYISLISNVRQFQSISRDAIIWVKSQFPSDHGYFAKSFWNTLDVITTLTQFEVPVLQYKDKIIEEISKHDRGGNYDEVLGATCAMYEIYDFYLGNEDVRTLTALQWILENYKNKVLFEQASAIDTLVRLKCNISAEEIAEFRDRVLDFFTTNNLSLSDNEFKLYRYCQTLFVCGFFEDARKIAFKFSETQDIDDGKWVNISHTAAVVELLIKIQDKTVGDKSGLDEMIFKGIEYLYDNYNAEKFSWNNDILSTVKSLRAIQLFEEKVKLPVDVIKNRIVEETKRINNFSAMDMASVLNLRYLQEGKNLKEAIVTLEQQKLKILKQRDKYYGLSRFLFPFLFFVVCVVVASVYIIWKNNLWSKVGIVSGSFIDENKAAILIAIVTILGWILAISFNDNKLIKSNSPSWVKKLIARIVPEPGFEINENKKEE